MKRQILSAAMWLALSLFASTIDATGQTSTPSPSPSPAPVDVMYTGRLLGYFRVPSLQRFKQGRGCPARSDADSIAAKSFLDYRQNNHAILVGMGDNFAPQLEARIFHEPPANRQNNYRVGNKELYYGTENGWEFYDNDNPELLQKLLAKIEAGHGTIPTDNVACFLRAARFAAIVPGRHDFYFGPERVRQFARFLASTSKENNYEPVQMLGANLVLKTVPIAGSPTAVAQPGVGSWPTDYEVLNLREGKSAYPWLPHIKIKVKKPSAAIEVRLCTSPGGPNQLPKFEDCTRLGELTNDVNTPVVLKLPRLGHPHSQNAKDGHFSTLLPATNYGLCVRKGSGMECFRFSSYTPFFYFPHAVPKHSADSYTDPDPFVVVNDRVAIFGVVDPDLGKNVGILNFGWKHNQADLTSRVSVEDPAEALQQQGGLITKDSESGVLLNDRPRAGMYWKVVLSRPITSKIKYELEDTGDFFFVNFNQDTTVDTRFRIISKHRLSFIIWPSVSIGPALDLLLYQNKVNRDFLFQRQFGFETKISFDIFNRREKGVQLRHKP